MKVYLSLVILFAACAAEGCTIKQRPFQPLVRLEQIHGRRAAAIQVHPREAHWADVSIWTDGIKTVDADKSKRLVHIGMKVISRSPEPLNVQLSDSTLRLHTENETFTLKPIEANGAVELQSNAERDIELRFLLPAKVSVEDAEHYEFVSVLKRGKNAAPFFAEFIPQTTTPSVRPFPHWYYEWYADPFYSPYAYPYGIWPHYRRLY